MLLAAFLSLVFSEVLWFKGEREAGLFIGLWVPSILGFAILLKLINNQKNDWIYPLFRWIHYHFVRCWLYTGFEQIQVKQVVA